MTSTTQAFLRLIMWAEGTDRAVDPFRVTYGYEHTIKDLSDHPAITGEWTGKRLPDKYCLALGLKPGCKSTAAGAFQIIRPTWANLRLTSPKLLPDFGKASQERAAQLLLIECGAFPLLEKGDLQGAIRRASRVWASLPSSASGQPQRKMKACLEKLAKLQAIQSKENGLPPR